MRTAILVALLALPCLANPGPGSWGGTETEGQSTKPAPVGSTELLIVEAKKLSTYVEKQAMVNPLSPNRDATAEASSTVWYTLEFVGSKDTTDHRWSILTEIKGKGAALAEVELQGGAWAESIEIIEMSGDHENEALGQLAVADRTTFVLSLIIPAGFRVAMDKTQRAQKNDLFEKKVPRRTSGLGKACRVRVDTYAKAHLGAKSTVGLASSWGYGNLRALLEMSGTCLVDGQRVTDRLRLSPGIWRDHDLNITPPSGGLKRGRGVPTDSAADGETNPDDDDSVPAGGDDDEDEDDGAETVVPDGYPVPVTEPETDEDTSTPEPLVRPGENPDLVGEVPQR